MLRNHLFSAVRSILRQWSYSLIHIVGLAIGLTAGTFVLYHARLEYSYDAFHADADRVYRVSTARVRDGVETTKFASTYAGAGPAMQETFPEIESYTRIFRRWRGGTVSYGDTRFREQNILHPDSGFFNVFSFPLLSGQPADLFPPSGAFIEAQTAKKYFGEEDPVGKRIQFGSADGIEEYEIRGVVRCPENSSIKFTFLFSYNNLTRIFGSEHLTNWAWLDFHTFVKLREHADPKALEGQFDALLKKHRGERAVLSRLSLQPLTDLYLKSESEFETGITGDENSVRILLALGVIIIVIVSLNFVNLSTSQAFARAREVGIRKTLGSTHESIVLRFLTETFLITAAAVLVSLLLLALGLPFFNQLTGRHLVFGDFVQQELWKYLGLFLVGGTLSIGIYPALQMASFKSVDVIKGFFVPRSHGAILRESFVGFQALVSFSLVVSILVIIDQVAFVRSQDTGVSIDQTLVVRAPQTILQPEAFHTSLESFKSELASDPRVLGTTTSADSPGEDVNWIGGARRISAPVLESISVYRSVIDADFVSTMGLTIVAGKGFGQRERSLDVMLNRTAAQALGYESPEASIGQRIVMHNDTCTIVGVMEDFHQVSPREAIAPTVFHHNLEPARLFFVRFDAKDRQEVVTLARAAYAKLFPQESFDYYFLDTFYDSQYASERSLMTIVMVFCFLAVVVSSLGLLGLTWFRMARQKKALAIRKIVGSTDAQLFVIASRSIVQTTLAGCAAGIPVTYFILTRWLEGFALHTEPHLWQFVLALVVSLLIALFTISAYSWKVIRANPAVHLRQE